MSDILSNWYPYIKALHIMSVIAWMAGLFYLPRLFVHHVETAGLSGPSHDLFIVMEEKLLRVIMNPAMIDLAVWHPAGDDTGDCRLGHGLAVDQGAVGAGNDRVSHVAVAPAAELCRGRGAENRPHVSHDERTADAADGRDRAVGGGEVLILLTLAVLLPI